MNKYIIISPVRNEEKYVGKTIQSVINQSVKPIEWIIVNDGSTDRTRETIEKYMGKYSWMKLINLEDRGFYYPGKGVVEVFYKGFNIIKTKDWDYIVKLDCDLYLENDYFEKIFQRFQENPRLGIASGCDYLVEKNSYIREKTQEDHPCGLSKIYRKKCFEDINGLRPIPGWDLVDVLSAQMKGWDTKCFMEYRIIHYRQTGFRNKGIANGRFFVGRLQYKFGYSFIYSLLKGIYKLFERPYFIGGIGMILGYLYACLRHETKYFDDEMIKFLRKKHREYLLNKLKF